MKIPNNTVNNSTVEQSNPSTLQNPLIQSNSISNENEINEDNTNYNDDQYEPEYVRSSYRHLWETNYMGRGGIIDRESKEDGEEERLSSTTAISIQSGDPDSQFWSRFPRRMTKTSEIN